MSSSLFTLQQGDCLRLMESIEPGSVDLILADLPYGTTACKWDSIIPLDQLWAHYRRVLKKGGVVALTSAQPFTSALVMSNPAWFKYDLVWDKVRPVGHLDAKRRPMRQHESVLIFAEGAMTYNPQMEQREKPRTYKRSKSDGSVYNRCEHNGVDRTLTHYFPRSILRFSNAYNVGKPHPTQKPVGLMEYLMNTYSNPGDLILDNCMGSGTTGVAAGLTGRRFAGMELDPGYFATAERRIREAYAGPEQGDLLLAV